MTTLESKIASFRSRNPLQPIPFELFPEFCQCWIEDYYKDNEVVLSKLSEAKVQSKVIETKIRKQTKSKEKVKLSGALRLHGRISEDCIKLDRGLKMLEEKIDCLELDVKKHEAFGEVLCKIAAKYVRPGAKKILQRIIELEQMEKELLGVVIYEEV